MINLIDFFKAVSDETRLRILVLLFNQELCVCEMCEILKESQPKISRHLAKLRDLGFVEDKRSGQWIFYLLKLQDKLSFEILDTIVKHVDQNAVLRADRQRLKEKIDKGTLCKREL